MVALVENDAFQRRRFAVLNFRGVVAPATADLLARATIGRADDLLTATLLTARCPVLYAPAMHTEMWFHPATVENVATLRRRGSVVMEPASGRRTGADTGPGRLPEAEEISTLDQLLLARGDALPYDMEGVKVLVTAGGTRERGAYQLEREAAQQDASPEAKPGRLHPHAKISPTAPGKRVEGTLTPSTGVRHAIRLPF